jgi:hypothetical protein
MSGLDNTSYTFRKVAVATTLTDNDSILLCTPTASFTVTLPVADPQQPGQVFYVTQSNVAGNQVTLAGAGAATIDGTATLVVGPVATKAAIKVVSDGTNWFTF